MRRIRMVAARSPSAPILLGSARDSRAGFGDPPTLHGVSDGIAKNDLAVRLSVLLGDTTGNANVNSSDVSLAKLKSGQVVDASNFRADVTANGSINSSDVSIVKLKSGTGLP